MVSICKTLENSKKPLLTKLNFLEKKKSTIISKLDEEMQEITLKLEAIDAAIATLQSSYNTKNTDCIKPTVNEAEQMPLEETPASTIDPFNFD